jgi:hypothetical protein
VHRYSVQSNHRNGNHADPKGIPMRTTMKDQFTAEQRAEWKPKIIARNTFRFEQNGETVYRLHSTDVARKRPDGSVILNSGGWRTLTTRDRMNSVLPAGVSLYQSKGNWYLKSGEKQVAYFDGIQVPQCFESQTMANKAKKTETKENKLRSQILKFTAKLDKLECLPEPDAGDCWYCSMRETKTGKPLGEASGNTEHLLSHIKEGYLHGSLIFNALEFVGYNNPSYIWHLENRNLKEGKKTDWTKRALRKYLYRKLGLAA